MNRDLVGCGEGGIYSDSVHQLVIVPLYVYLHKMSGTCIFEDASFKVGYPRDIIQHVSSIKMSYLRS
jgi:hypothetical protein